MRGGGGGGEKHKEFLVHIGGGSEERCCVAQVRESGIATGGRRIFVCTLIQNGWG